MPKGQYTRTTRLPKEDVMEFVMFCFRDDIAQQLERVKRPHLLAVNLFKAATGKDIKPSTAYNQRNKWEMVDGKLYRSK